ncbi:MAG: hypothetical protein H7333_04650 [Bdellovibrionales bacterium]|nr:hypothetical protein [Oligoflexia bacterium]
MPEMISKKSPYKTAEQIARLNDRVPELDLDASDEDDLRGIATLSNEEANFKSELDYDGYSKIEDYDNNALELNVDKKGDPKELKFDDREEDDSITEEISTDPQDNHAREQPPLSDVR